MRARTGRHVDAPAGLGQSGRVAAPDDWPELGDAAVHHDHEGVAGNVERGPRTYESDTRRGDVEIGDPVSDLLLREARPAGKGDGRRGSRDCTGHQPDSDDEHDEHDYRGDDDANADAMLPVRTVSASASVGMVLAASLAHALPPDSWATGRRGLRITSDFADSG